MFTQQEINFPSNCRIITHDLFNYDPENEFNIENSIKYLNEDLLQCYFPLEDLKVDLGWYGNIVKNEGEFRIYIIQSENWEYPVKVIHSKSIEETKTLLNNILKYYAEK